MLTNIINEMIQRSTKTKAVKAQNRLAYVRKGIETNPAGDRNSKTASLGTYRPVGVTCPESCPYLNKGCYAQAGRCALAANRASADPKKSVLALVAALLASRGEPVRLHVSGDFAFENNVQVEYIDLLVRSLKYLQFRDIPVTVWTYTACDLTPEQLSDLKSAGVHVRRSGVDTNVALVAPKGSFQCPAQTGKKESCSECKLCWTVKRQVNFIPHSTLASKFGK